MNKISVEIKEIFRKHDLLERLTRQEALLVWDQVAGSMNKFTRPLLVKEGKLIVEVSSSSAKQELSYLEEEYKKKINERLEESRIDKIEFVVESFPKEKTGGVEGMEIEDEKLDSKEKEAVKNLLDDINLDQELKESIENLMVSKLKADKVRLKNGWRQCEKCGRIHRGRECPRCKFSS